MSAAGIDSLRPLLNQGIGRPNQCPSCIDDVVNQEGGHAIDISDDIHHLRDIGRISSFVNDRQGSVESFCIGSSPFHSACIGETMTISFPRCLRCSRSTGQQIDDPPGY